MERSVSGLGVGESDEWYTPREIFDALGLTFDLDPCSPGPRHWVPARRIYTKADDGLSKDWSGQLVYCNPPFGGRNGHVPWLIKWLRESPGIYCCRAYTSAAWFHQHAIKAEAILFPAGKTKFIRPDGSVGGSPAAGVAFLGRGAEALEAFRNCGLGWVATHAR